MKPTFVHEKFTQKPIDKPENAIYISYTQFSTFQKCALRWKLKYIDKIKDDKPSIHTVFGNAMHNVIQHYYQTLFNETVKKADSLEFDKLLLHEIKEQYKQEIEKFGSHFSTKEQLIEFYLDGLQTLNYLKKKRKSYVDKKNWVLVGTELPILIPGIESKPNVLLMGFLDVVFKEKKGNKFFIHDLKTSTKGWSKWDKDDQTKIDQLLLYKIYFSKQYNIPIDDVEVEFIILKRKIDEDSMWPQRRIQTFKPTQGSVSYKRTLKTFETFINTCFTETGNYNSEFQYEAKSGKNGFNCRFCEFNEREDLCPKQNRLTE